MKKGNHQFDVKWASTLNSDSSEEFSIFVPVGKTARTQRQLFLQQYFYIIRKHLEQRPSAKILEMGCGRGTLSLYFALYHKAEVTLCDLSESAVALAKANFAFHNAQGIIEVAPAEKTPFAANYFDLVFSIGLLEHLDNYQLIVDEKFRLLKSGAVVASLNIPKKKSIQVLNTMYRRFLKIFGFNRLKSDYYRNAQTPEDYKKAFEKAGFVDCKVLHVAPFPIFTPLPKPLEYFLTLIYRCLILVRSSYKSEPFEASTCTAQAHFIFARKP